MCIKRQYSSDSLSTFGIIKKSQYVLCKKCEGAAKRLPYFSAVGQDKLVTCKRRCVNYRRKIRLKYVRIRFTHTVKKNAETLVAAAKEIGPEVNADKTKYMVVSRDQRCRTKSQCED